MPPSPPQRPATSGLTRRAPRGAPPARRPRRGVRAAARPRSKAKRRIWRAVAARGRGKKYEDARFGHAKAASSPYKSEPRRPNETRVLPVLTPGSASSENARPRRGDEGACRLSVTGMRADPIPKVCRKNSPGATAAKADIRVRLAKMMARLCRTQPSQRSASSDMSASPRQGTTKVPSSGRGSSSPSNEPKRPLGVEQEKRVEHASTHPCEKTRSGAREGRRGATSVRRRAGLSPARASGSGATSTNNAIQKFSFLFFKCFIFLV
jgi:hypothetical protein